MKLDGVFRDCAILVLFPPPKSSPARNFQFLNVRGK